MIDNITSPNIQGHRGAFGEYSGDDSQFIDRTFVERILLVGVVTKQDTFNEVLNSLKELSLLVRTANADPVEKILIKRDVPHSGTFIGKGKVLELYKTCEQLDIDTVVFDNDLTASQQVNLEKVIGRSAIDRTTVILDIFAQNAVSLEGKVQIELAQLKHRSAKLRKSNATYSQQAGGIGSRGPGETKLETDRRSILRRTRQLEKKLKVIATRRDSQAKRRRSTNISSIALVGYTNAGKSSLLNVLTNASAITKNRLFSTLEATTRRLEFKGGRTCLIADTVGFIKKLPTILIEAFASTLSSIVEADLLIHVIDATVVDIEVKMQEVNNILKILDTHETPQLLVFNKIDKLSQDSTLSALKIQHPTATFISAETKTGIEELLEEISIRISKGAITESLLVPFSQGDIMADIHRSTRVIEKKSTDQGILYKVEVISEEINRFEDYKVS